MQKILTDPYRVFFPLGLIYLLASVTIWFPIAFFGSDYYPVLLHHYLIVDGFLFSFMGGFLMTAIPKFSQSFPSKKFEILIYLALPLLGLKDALLESNGIYLVSLLQSLFLLQFIILRVFKRKANPPNTFIFIPLALVMICIMSVLGYMDSAYFSIEAFFLCPITLIILAIGCRLIPAILGHKEIVLAQRAVYEQPLPLHKIIPMKILILGFIFILTFFKEHWLSNLVQFQIVAYFANAYWKIFEAPKKKSALTWSLWFTCWISVLGFLLKLVWPDGVIHGLHWIFIGSFLSFIILIATRVTVSHAKQDSSLENSKFIYWIIGLINLAMSTRVLAFVLDGLYESHLGYGSFLIYVAIILWIYKFGRFFFV